MVHTLPITESCDVLVLVHPDSACSSADIHYCSPAIAQWRREALITELTDWRNSIIVIDGDLHPELRETPFTPLSNAIDTCIRRAQLNNLISIRAYATYQTMARTTRRILRQLLLAPNTTRFHVTGAWYNSNHSGCVATMTDTLILDGYTTRIADSALR